jgi:hypothetical protein
MVAVWARVMVWWFSIEWLWVSDAKRCAWWWTEARCLEWVGVPDVLEWYTTTTPPSTLYFLPDSVVIDNPTTAVGMYRIEYALTGTFVSDAATW